MHELLKVEQLGMTRDGQELFSNLSFTLKEDDWLTVVGPSGGGKSTLLKALAHLEQPTTGTVELNNGNSDLTIAEYRQTVSYAVQSAQLFGNTVRDNLNLPFEVRGLEPNEKRQQTGLVQMGLDPLYLDKEIEELSGGQRQRVGVLRNLLFPPTVLLLDEITTGLDQESKQVLWQVIRDLQKEHHFAVVSVTHDQGEITGAAWQLTIGEGKVGFSHE
ncbi:ABC transporter ATP-binding protein [Weissella soli]|jgi:putative ABC transport system ATP-binding protein|uniref:ABC transporter ATP-binding protein n=1 Tax=Weissella soli TaxID=155866 RepID=UPI001F464C87|nr:ATP-binding cassette domain-containing protein [Weissella soli]GJM48208.1 ABC transporter ATP-binding protein [Weissella soli]